MMTLMQEGGVPMWFILAFGLAALASSSVVRRDLRPLVTSQLHVLFHVFLVGPALAARSDEITELLTGLNDSDKGRQMLAALGSTHWRRVSQEDAEFMIDIISTLAQ